MKDNLKSVKLERLRQEFIGLDVLYELANGKKSKRIYLDSAATTLSFKVVDDVIRNYQPYYSNTHSLSHFGAKLTSKEYAWAHRIILRFVQANHEEFTTFFVGSGATAGINRVAAVLKKKRPDRNVVVTTIMEHHSNDLPHRKHFPKVIHVPVSARGSELGSIDLHSLEKTLKSLSEKVNYVAVTGASNVTGIINPIYKIAQLAHKYGALILVDAAQMAAHMPVKMSGHKNVDRDIDLLVLSGHKAYSPGSPGAVVGRKDLFSGIEPLEVGGGVVEDVYPNRYMLKQEFPDREEAGTPNICGGIALSAALYCLERIGMSRIAREEYELVKYAMEKLKLVPGIVIYGETDLMNVNRLGTISFNIENFDHTIIAQILNDYYNISVRNACFCAHPYVRELITEKLGEQAETLSDTELDALAELHRGMVRVSFGIYNHRKDVDALVAALQEIVSRKAFYESKYLCLPNGEYRHKTFRFDSDKYFSAKDQVDAFLSEMIGRGDRKQKLRDDQLVSIRIGKTNA